MNINVTLVQLQTFARLAEVGNFTRVAEELYLTQPAVTQQVRALERNLGVRLIDVVGRRPVLTDGGRFLAARARELLSSAAVLQRDMGEFAGAQAGELRVGATLTIGAYALPAILSRFAVDHPGVDVQVEVSNTASIAQQVASGTLSLALIEGPLEDDRFEARPVQQDRLVLVTRPDHPLASAERVSLQDLNNAPFIWRERGSGTRALVEQALEQRGIHVRSVLELPSGEGVARAVETGLGVAILSVLVVERAVAQGQLAMVEIDDVDLTRSFRLIHLRDRTLSPAAQAFVQLLAPSPETAMSPSNPNPGSITA